MIHVFQSKLHFFRILSVLTLVSAGITSTSIAAFAVLSVPIRIAIGTSTHSPRAATVNQPNRGIPVTTPAVNSVAPKIVFGSARNNGNHDIFLMDLDGSNQTRLTTSGAYDDQPKWSPDSSKIAFISGRDGNFEIYTMNPDGTYR